MKIKKITLLIVTLLNIFCAQELICAAAAGAGQKNLETQILKAADNLYDNVGNMDPVQKKQLDDLINRLNVNQIKNILAKFRNKTAFIPQQDTLIHLLLKQIITLGTELEDQDLIELIKLAKTLQFDREMTAGSLNHNFPAGSTEANWANMGIRLRRQFVDETNKEIIPKLEDLLKLRIGKSMQNMEKSLIQGRLVPVFATPENREMAPELLALIAEYANISDEEALKAVVLPNIQKTEERCVIA